MTVANQPCSLLTDTSECLQTVFVFKDTDVWWEIQPSLRSPFYVFITALHCGLSVSTWGSCDYICVICFVRLYGLLSLSFWLVSTCTRWRRCQSGALGRRTGSPSEEDDWSTLPGVPPRPRFDLAFCKPTTWKKGQVLLWFFCAERSISVSENSATTCTPQVIYSCAHSISSLVTSVFTCVCLFVR